MSWLGIRGNYGSRALPIHDNARTTPENREHWKNASNVSPNVANSPYVRQTLRTRARYEIENNSYLAGLVQTITNDVIGTGPRPQFSANLGNPEASAVAREIITRIRIDWAAWAKASGLAANLRLMQRARLVDGESFAMFVENPQLPTAVSMDLKVVEADQFDPRFQALIQPNVVDGITIDDLGQPIKYTFLDVHPGDPLGYMTSKEREVPASSVLHWFRRKRPGQVRGTTDLQPSLGLGAQMRRYTLAVIQAAEFAACIAGVMKTTAPPMDGPSVESGFDEVPLQRGMLMKLPDGFDASQFKAEQPTGTYKDFKGEILNEMGRCVNAPFNVIAGNSSGYNYSSGRLDHQIYHASLWIERDDLELMILNRIARRWLLHEVTHLATQGKITPEAFLLLRQEIDTWPIEWNWDGFASIDPEKDIAAAGERIRRRISTHAEECAAEGKDWVNVFHQLARERELAEELGIVNDPFMDSPFTALPVDEVERVEENEAKNGKA